MPTVSVIIPVYKAEAWLSRCVSSILAQSFADFELILVDDGSPDSCPGICDAYAETDSRVTVIHQKNSGASAARNAGLDSAGGQYILFCDSDDAVSPQWMAHLLAAAKDGSVYPMCAYCTKPEDLGSAQLLEIPAGQVFPNSAYYQFQKSGIAGYVWNGLFLRQILEENHIRFRDNHSQGNYNEDLLFSLTYVRHIPAISYVGFRDYLYDAHEGSLSHAWDRYAFPKYEEKYQLWTAHLDRFAPEDLSAREHLAQTMLYRFFLCLNSAFSEGDCRKFRRILSSDAVRDCAAVYNGTGENPTMVRLICGGHSRLLWIFYTLSRFKSALRGNRSKGETL